MATPKIWTGTSTFIAGQTPYGFYDTDPIFALDADKTARFCTIRLGYPLMDVELDSGSLYTCFEQAITTYGNEVYQYKVRENYISLEGTPTGSAVNNRLIDPTLHRVIGIAKNYGTEANVGGNVPRFTGSVALQLGVQQYDLNQWAIDQGISGSMEIQRVFYQPPPAILRYFDPYAGTGTGIQSLMDAFDFGSYSPGVNFLLMPASYDMMKVQAIEFNDQIRRSAYSFELVNNKLRIMPVPKTTGSILFEYYNTLDRDVAVVNTNPALVTNASEVPYLNPVYSRINSVGRQWIYQYTLALAKETLAYIRGKYEVVPVPGSEVTLNQQDLLTDARQEKADLIQALRDTLEETSRRSQLERKSNENDHLQNTLKGVPLVIYVG